MTIEMDWKAYQEGKDATIKYDSDVTKVDNPYPKDSLSWKSWNYGWNTN